MLIRTTLKLSAMLFVIFVLSYGGTGCDPDPDEGCYGDCICYGAECVCPDSGDCEVHCGDSCDLSCTGSGNCDFICDVACNVSCSSSGECWSDVLAGSAISCTGSGDCYITCHGDCSVHCPGSGVCTLYCLDEGICDITGCNDEVEVCADGTTSVCGSACP